MRNELLKLFFLLLLSLPLEVKACDPCSLYSAARLQGNQVNQWSFSISEQYTDFDKVDQASQQVLKNEELTRSFTTTQLSVGYDFLEWLGLQITLPFVYRSYDRSLNYRVKTDTESGIGDIVIASSFTPFCIFKPELTFVSSIIAGIKLPTGDTGSLSESIEVSSDDEELEKLLRHHVISANSSGRALSIGSGSFDFPLVASFFLRKQRLMMLVSAQYTFRNEGDFDYKFADDFVWDFGPGVYLLSSHASSLAARLVLSGEQKSSDKRDGAVQQDSKLSNFYLGPQLLFTLGEGWVGELGFDMLVENRRSDSVESDFRVRSGLTYSY